MHLQLSEGYSDVWREKRATSDNGNMFVGYDSYIPDVIEIVYET